MTTAERPSLTRHVSPEEEYELLTKAFDEFGKGNEEEGYAFLAQVPLIPGLCEFVIEETGWEYSREHFNLINLRQDFKPDFDKR